MNATQIQIEQADVLKLLSAANGDAALVYLYIRSGNHPDGAGSALGLNESRLSLACATLRQLGLWPEEKSRPILTGERPRYSELDVIRAMNTDIDFKALSGDIEHRLGKSLTTEELKILLGFVRYLGMGPDVICLLVNYCRERARQKGSSRMPSLRTIEKEAYAWAEQGIDTIEEAAAYMQQQNLRQSRISRLMNTLQIRGRNLTPGEEKYAKQWLEWGFEEDAIAMAYERTCLNTGGLNWAYMNKILSRWHAEGLKTPQQIASGDQKKQSKPKTRGLDDDERAALAALMEG